MKDSDLRKWPRERTGQSKGLLEAQGLWLEGRKAKPWPWGTAWCLSTSGFRRGPGRRKIRSPTGAVCEAPGDSSV